MSVQALFNPRGVALCGSTSPGKIGYELLRNIVEGGYADVQVSRRVRNTESFRATGIKR